ncbi:MAG: HAD family hydrolase [Chloroflexi bacterium]|nr:HAD family hydrolase [Chloroflexota bacterium]
MADILVNGRVYPNIQLIAFDKDGTLLDFHHLWGHKARLWVRWLIERVGGVVDNPQSLRQTLTRTLGYNPTTQRVIDDSPMAVASMPRLANIAATVLYQHGIDWHQAEQIAQTSMPASIGALPITDQVKSLGDVAGAMTRLVQAEIKLAIITSDDRAASEATLPLMGIEHLIDVLICGNDDISNKPAPDALWQVGQQLNIDPAHMLMIGDTVGDMIFGRRAGVAGCIGIRGGAGNQTALSKHADEVIDTIEGIQVSK